MINDHLLCANENTAAQIYTSAVMGTSTTVMTNPLETVYRSMTHDTLFRRNKSILSVAASILSERELRRPMIGRSLMMPLTTARSHSWQPMVQIKRPA
jgi:hypothetical protein